MLNIASCNRVAVNGTEKQIKAPSDLVGYHSKSRLAKPGIFPVAPCTGGIIPNAPKRLAEILHVKHVKQTPFFLLPVKQLQTPIGLECPK